MSYSKSRIAEIICEHAEYNLRNNFADRRARWLKHELCPEGTCDVCDVSYAAVEFFKNPPITLFQAQLITWEACVEGRMRVGDKTARDWWLTSTQPSDMLWLMGMLGVNCPDCDEFYETEDTHASRIEACDSIRSVVSFETLQALREGK